MNLPILSISALDDFTESPNSPALQFELLVDSRMRMNITGYLQTYVDSMQELSFGDHLG